MKVAFYIAKHGNFMDKLIAWWTAPLSKKFNNEFLELPSHVELVLSYQRQKSQDGTPISYCFSSSQRDGGVRHTYINLANGHWLVKDLQEFDNYEATMIAERIRDLKGKGYDWLGILFTFIYPFRAQDQNKWWCSEAVAYVIGEDKYHIHPLDLCRLYE